MQKNGTILILVLFMILFLAGCDQFYFTDYEASGRVEDSGGMGIEAATINFSDGSSVKSLSDGTWKQTGLKGDIEITPKKSGYNFSPITHNLSHFEENKNNIVFKAESNGTDSEDNSNDSDVSDENEENTFILSGIVEDESEQGISEVIIHFNNGEFSTVMTADDGSWKKEGLTGQIEVTAEKYGYSFEPAARSLETTDENVNFRAIAEEQTYTASGKITNESNIPIPDVNFSFSDGSTVQSDYNGDWEKTGLTGDVTVTPELDDWQFKPANVTLDELNNSADFTAQPGDNFEYYTLSGVIQNTNGEYIYIKIEREDGTLIADAVTDEDGNWTANNVWGTVEIIPQTRGTINEFEPTSKTRSGTDEKVDFIAE